LIARAKIDPIIASRERLSNRPAAGHPNELSDVAAYVQAPQSVIDRAELARIALLVLIVSGELDTLVGSPDELANPRACE
jgi:hypothetical protein